MTAGDGAPPPAEPSDLDTALDALYGMGLEEFTPARDALVRTLRARKQAELARSVQRLRKPSLSAWVTNQLVREAPAEVGELLDRGAALRVAQQQALDGSRTAAGELRTLAAAEREAVAVLVRRGAALLTAAGHAAADGTLDRLGQSLHTAATTAAGARVLRQGRLERDLDAAGFGDLEAEGGPDEPAGSARTASEQPADAGPEPDAVERPASTDAGPEPDAVEQEAPSLQAARLAEELEVRRLASEAAVEAADAAEGEVAARRQAEAAARAGAEQLRAAAANLDRLAREAGDAAAAAEMAAERARRELEDAEAAALAARAEADELVAALAAAAETG